MSDKINITNILKISLNINYTDIIIIMNKELALVCPYANFQIFILI